jgi:molybdenum cofactor sulfurtransferase
VNGDPRFAAFLQQFPDFLSTTALDQLRATGFGRLDQANHVYLDYTGAALYADAQIDEHLTLLRNNIFGNPHSANPTSIAMTDLVEQTRRDTLDYFNASGNYHLVFTLNASGALKLIGESFPFTAESRFVATYDNHNSVNGIREFARKRGAQVAYSPLTTPNLRIDEAALNDNLNQRDPSALNLFAFPAQSNYSGVRHPLAWVERAKRLGWRVLLDAAAFVPTNRLDLTQTQPDFVSISFYKMFGYPAGIGALLIHKDAMPLLQRPWFSGGTVNFTTVQKQSHLLSSGEAGFEDGTINYLSIPAVGIGLRHLSAIGIENIQTRISCLTGHMLQQLQALCHTNGQPLVKLHGPADCESRGGTITFNLYDPTGLRLDYRRVEELAGQTGISIRTGCFCNPGANESAEGLSESDLAAGLALGPELNLPNFVKLMDTMGINKSAGAIRVSLGLATNFKDIARCLDFLSSLLNQARHTIGEVTVEDDNCRVIRDSS